MSFPIVLLQPRWLGFWNRWSKGGYGAGARLRDFVISLFGLGTLLAIFFGTQVALERIAVFESVAYFPPKIPFSILLLFLFVMLTLSCSVTAVGAFFLSSDRDLILASPVSGAQFFCAKLLTVVLQCAWMPLSFIIPFLAAFGVHYGAGYTYYLSWFAVFIPYFVIPATIAVLASHIIISLVTPGQVRMLLGIVLTTVVVLLVRAGSFIGGNLSEKRSLEELLRILTVLSFPDVLWLPSHWAALACDGLLLGEGEAAIIPIALLWSTMAALLFLSYGVFTVLFPVAITRSAQERRSASVISQTLSQLKLGRKLPIPSFALLLKDYRMLYRDLPQVIQLVLLFSLYVIYIYNLRVFALVNVLNEQDQASWRAFFFITNASMGAFVTTAAATRLVFPALSLEGRAFWVLQTSPLSLHDVLRNKFWTWLPPIGILASVTFTTGNIALGSSLPVIIATFLIGWFLSAGIIALGLAIGALFLRLDWEHSAQLVSSFGSFVFMLASIFLITLNMIPLGISL
ncbi:hypothetical protein MRY87_05595, partial [bacterium]|nr:hypothetical protein [bacterium]